MLLLMHHPAVYSVSHCNHHPFVYFPENTFLFVGCTKVWQQPVRARLRTSQWSDDFLLFFFVLLFILECLEPWPGDTLADPLLITLPGHADKKNLVPFYNRLAAAIRAVDNNKLIFWEVCKCVSVLYVCPCFFFVVSSGGYPIRGS